MSLTSFKGRNKYRANGTTRVEVSLVPISNRVRN